MRISNFTSNKGNKVANQFLVEDQGVSYFQSYTTMIGKRDINGVVTLDPKWDYSVTTLKYCKQWLNTDNSKKEIQKLIDDGFYKYENLN